MQIPLQVTVRGMAHSPALDERIRTKVASLERFHGRITRCRVTVSGPDRHRQGGRQFEVGIEVHAPGQPVLVVTRQHDEDVHVALRDAVGAAVRQLEDATRVQRGDVKAHRTPPMP
jgi:ribosome-associated translation inhibitor RaiA